jgi:hypothetical protein
VTLRVTLLALVTALSLAACGGDEGDEPQSQAATSAAATTEQEATTAESAEGEGSAAVLLAAGRNTLEAGSSRVYVEADVGGRSFTGEGSYDYGDHVGEMQLDLGGLGDATGLGELELVFADYVVYYHLPLGVLPGEKEWIKIDVEALGDSAAVDLQQLAQGNQSDPAQYLRWLGAVGEDVEELGTETVRGVETTHYRATVDLDRVVDEAEPEVRGATKLWIDLLKRQLELGEVPIDVWVDEDGLVRRIEQEYELDGTRTQITMELDDFGIEVDAEAPPADQVIDLGELGGAL